MVTRGPAQEPVQLFTYSDACQGTLMTLPLPSKPWLASATLHMLTRQIAGATRVAQKQLKRAGCADSYKAVFPSTDLVLLELRHATHAVDNPTFEALADELSSSSAPEAISVSTAQSSNPNLSSEDWIHGLADDRLSCIRPVLVHDIKRAVGIETSPVSHPRTLRRNVAAHVRGKGALLKIFELDAKGLRMAQKEKLTDGSMDAPPDLAQTDAEVDGNTFPLHASLASIHAEVQKLSVRFEQCYGIDQWVRL